MARSSQPKVAKATKRSGSKSQPKTVGAHAKRVASQPKLSGNKKRR